MNKTQTQAHSYDVSEFSKYFGKKKDVLEVLKLKEQFLQEKEKITKKVSDLLDLKRKEEKIKV
jgi:hypothetical protein